VFKFALTSSAEYVGVDRVQTAATGEWVCRSYFADSWRLRMSDMELAIPTSTWLPSTFHQFNDKIFPLVIISEDGETATNVCR